MQGGGLRMTDLMGEQPEHNIAGNIETVNSIDGAEEGFGGVGQDGILIALIGQKLPLAQENVLAEPDFAGDIGKPIPGHDTRTHFRYIGFGSGGVLLE